MPRSYHARGPVEGAFGGGREREARGWGGAKAPKADKKTQPVAGAQRELGPGLTVEEMERCLNGKTLDNLAWFYYQGMKYSQLTLQQKIELGRRVVRDT